LGDFGVQLVDVSEDGVLVGGGGGFPVRDGDVLETEVVRLLLQFDPDLLQVQLLVGEFGHRVEHFGDRLVQTLQVDLVVDVDFVVGQLLFDEVQRVVELRVDVHIKPADVLIQRLEFASEILFHAFQTHIDLAYYLVGHVVAQDCNCVPLEFSEPLVQRVFDLIIGLFHEFAQLNIAWIRIGSSGFVFLVVVSLLAVQIGVRVVVDGIVVQ